MGFMTTLFQILDVKADEDYSAHLRVSSIAFLLLLFFSAVFYFMDFPVSIQMASFAALAYIAFRIVYILYAANKPNRRVD